MIDARSLVWSSRWWCMPQSRLTALPGRRPRIAEINGIKTVTALLKAGAGLEVELAKNEDEGDFRFENAAGLLG